MKRVLLTGASGFIGRHCLPLLLASDYEVHAVALKASRANWAEVFWHQANLLDSQETMELIATVQPTHLLHFAWYAVPGSYQTSLENLRWVQASLAMLQAFALQGGQRIVMAGTCAEYDWKYGYCSENITPLMPSTMYGICKHSLQVLSSAFAKQAGLSMAWGRIFFLYGPHEYPTRFVPSVISSLLREEPAHCSHGNQIRDFLHVEDVASAFVALLQSDVSGAVNIGSGLPVSLKEIACMIGEKIGRSDLVRLGDRVALPNDPPLLVADTRRLREHLGWVARFNVDFGLDQTIQWWRENLQGGFDGN